MTLHRKKERKKRGRERGKEGRKEKKETGTKQNKNQILQGLIMRKSYC